MQTEQPTLSSVFVKFKPLDIKDNILEVTGKVNGFEKEIVEQKRAYLTRIFSEMLQMELSLHLKYELVKEEKPRPKAAEKQDKKEIMEKIRREGGEAIQKLIDDIDLELI